jgi:peptidoglycan/xylan/chitin deacetylase (PgdA/CDA1 family)
MEIARLIEAGVGLGAGLGLGGYAYAAMWPASQLFGATLQAPSMPDTLAMTFDDGPNPRWTPQLLEILARHRVRATFFLIGQYAATQRPLVRQMHEAGHLIANHTWTHSNLARTGRRETREQLLRTSGELESITGAPVRLFRPPFGARSPFTVGMARELGLTAVTWNAMTSDWSATDAEPVARALTAKITGNQKAGRATNLVLHDGGQHGLEVDRSASIAAAGRILAEYAGRVKTVTLDAWLAEAGN